MPAAPDAGWTGRIGPVAAAAVLAGVLLAGRGLGILDRTFCGRRRLLSAAAGASLAYVFVRVLPEMSEFQVRFAATTTGRSVAFPDYWVYFAALLGFVLFYGLENMVFGHRSETHTASLDHRNELLVRTLHIGGFAVYCGLISYLMVDWTHGNAGLALYCLAMAFHFMVIDHSLRSEYGEDYDARGRWWLASSVAAGWALAQLRPLSDAAMATMQGFVAGGVTINSVRNEMPGAGEGRFGWFVGGACAFALLLMISYE